MKTDIREAGLLTTYQLELSKRRYDYLSYKPLLNSNPCIEKKVFVIIHNDQSHVFIHVHISLNADIENKKIMYK